MSNNQSSRPSRWGSNDDAARNHSQSFDAPPPAEGRQLGRGYDTTGGGPSPFLRDHEHDRERVDDRRDFGRRRDSRGHDWRCMECGLFNDPRNERCPRCGEWRPRERGWDERDRGRDMGRDEEGYYGPARSRDYDDQDEYDSRRRKKPRPEPKKPEWPPAFEAGGASYVFDARSGMFYEPASDFFYDPKTKLYYSNKKQKYFHFMKGETPEFQEVNNQQQGGANAGGTTKAEAAGDAATSQPFNPTANGADQSKIAISLKTTALPSTSNAPASSVASDRLKLIEKLRKASSVQAANTQAEPQVDKKHAKNMDVWSNRIKEMKGEAPDVAPIQSEETPIKTTTSGQPICVLCRRKFANLEKLRQHEQFSAMHKENLAKKAAANAKKETTTPETTYRDRTKERQMLYSASSVDTTHVDKLLASMNPTASVEKKTDVIHPEQTLGESNMGNQLLQKMGWKQGESLGRKQEGESGAETKSGSNAANNLKNDWERIESLAHSGGHGRR